MSATIIGWVDNATLKASKPSEQVETTQPTKKSSSATKTASKKNTSKKG